MAKTWNITERRITGLCRSGDIHGAVKKNGSWQIPLDSERPIDKRIKSGKYAHLKKSHHLPLPVGVSDYRLASTQYYYIDKTLMLKDIIDERAMVTLFTRPRRFGKTLNMDMIHAFFEKTEEDTSKYFIDKKIWAQGKNTENIRGSIL